MLQCTGIDHIALVTHDMEATVQFYTNILAQCAWCAPCALGQR
jgi:catechol 2,3-dioxygenase-like lactoylglutathione lyase family enzyme